jgi:peptidylprolyl isomerase
MIRYFSKSWKIGLIFCLIVTARPASGVAKEDPLRHGYALIIGAWAYDDPRWPRLGDIKLQIKQLQTGLAPHFDGVELLSNPSFDQLDIGLRRFLRNHGNDEKARLFIYYAGHGFTELNAMRNEYRGYVTGIDTPYVDGSTPSIVSARVKALSMEAIREIVSDVDARQVLFVFDSCFAGTIFTARSASEASGPISDADIAKFMNLPVREFITAGDVNEKVPAHSPLPQLLLNAIGGAADPYALGVVTGQQIAQYFWSQTRGVGLSPREGKLAGGYFDRGEFLFRVLDSEKTNLSTSQNVEQSTPADTKLALSRPPDLGGKAMVADVENTLYMDVSAGRVVIQMRPDLAPATCAQIKALVRRGFYDGLTFHRVIDGFMAQTGDPKGDGTGGSGHPVKAEFSSERFVRGVVGMARASDPNSGDSQFFIVFAPNPSLDGKYTVWGKVVSGMQYIDAVKKGDPARNGYVSNPDKIITMQVAADAEKKS